jgi:hypothetical protein
MSSGGSSSGGASGAKGDGGKGGKGNGGSSGSGGGNQCNCKPNPSISSWIDCNGCCCWLAPGSTCSTDKICDKGETCCAGKGPGW